MKPITSDNYLIRPFRARKGWNVTHTFLSVSNPPQVFIDLAVAPPSTWGEFNTASEAKNSSGIYRRTLYRSVQNLFYETGSSDSSSSVRFLRAPQNKGFQPIESQFYVVNIPQQVFGETVNPGTFRITSPVSTASIFDDGMGRLVSSENIQGVVGNIFYSLGIAVVGQFTGSYSGSLVTDKGLFLTTGSQVQVQFEGLHTIYEHQIICTADPGEFNFSVNPTMRSKVLSGSFSGGPTFVTQEGESVTDTFFSGSLSPYITTVGLYNDKFELVAVAKFPRAIRRVPTTQQTVIVRFDA
jgi:hypothetical protein